MRVLVVNTGSSSLKLALVDEDETTLGERELALEGGRVDLGDVMAVVGELGAPEAIGHRLVHGGRRFLVPTRIDGEVEAALRELADLAPLHQAPALAALDAVSEALPGVPAVACFDTAFHATLPAAAATYALPKEWRERWDLRRFGFHGLSHAYAARRAARLAGSKGTNALRIVSCHLGAGASIAAVLRGRSVDTTMGFTPLDGLVMGTRSGSVDPGLLLWLLERGGLTVDEASNALERESGLLGLAGTADMREVLERAREGDADAVLARDVYLHRLRAGMGAMTAAMEGLDVLVFTGRVGERSPEIRAAAARGLSYTGVSVHTKRNEEAAGDTEIGSGSAPVRIFVITAREDLEIARQVRAVLG